MKRKVLIIYTGGTIGMEKDYNTGSLKPFDFDLIFDKLPEIKLLDCDTYIHGHTGGQADEGGNRNTFSHDMDLPYWSCV